MKVAADIILVGSSLGFSAELVINMEAWNELGWSGGDVLNNSNPKMGK